MDAYLRMKQEIDVFFRADPKKSLFALEATITPTRIADLLRFLLGDRMLLSEIAERSCHHSQGFLKIVLIEGPAEARYRLRFHVWANVPTVTRDAPIAGIKHNHGWDLGSRVLAGTLKEHWYDVTSATEAMHAIHEQFETAMLEIPVSMAETICERLDVLEARSLPPDVRLVRLHGGLDALAVRADVNELTRILGLSEETLHAVLPLMLKYCRASERDRSHETYQVEDLQCLTLIGVYSHLSGSFRVQPNHIAHRMIVDPSVYTATALVTTPPDPTAPGGAFVRSSRAKDDTDLRARPRLSADDLTATFRSALERFG